MDRTSSRSSISSTSSSESSWSPDGISGERKTVGNGSKVDEAGSGDLTYLYEYFGTNPAALAEAMAELDKLSEEIEPPTEVNVPKAKDSDNDEKTLLKVATEAAPLLEELQEKVGKELANDPKAQWHLKALTKISAKAAKRAALPRKAEQPLAKIMTDLERRHQMLLRLDKASPLSSTASGSKSSSDKTAGASPPSIYAETIGAFELASLTLRHNSGVPTDKNRSEIKKATERLEYVLRKLGEDTSMAMDLREDAITELQLKLNELKEIRATLKDYSSPQHQRKLIEERLLYVDSAYEIFVSLLRDTSETAMGGHPGARDAFKTEAEHFKKCLEARRDALRTCLAIPEKARSGTIDASFLNRLKKRDRAAFEDITLDENMPESTLMAALVDTFLLHHPRADFRSGKEVLAQMKVYVLNRQRDWKVISSEVMIPVDAPPPATGNSKVKAATDLAKVTATTSPAGHVLNAPGLSIVSKSSAMVANDLADYRAKDPADPKKTITTGFNSHSTTEHKHGANIAKSTASVAGKTLFAGTRHGTLSAYEIHTDILKKMPDASIKQMFDDMTRTVDSVTQICTSTEIAAAVQKNPPPYFASTEFDDLWKEATGNLDEAGFIDKARNDEDFCSLMRRKTALNRAREVFLTEALSNPDMLKRIREGKPIAFTSLSLITPDPFRYVLGKLFPQKFRIHDELSMRREEVQAWKDLQEAINNGQIEIDGKVVSGEIISLSVGVNQLSLGKTLGTFGRWLLSGWNQVAEENSENFTKLVGDPAQKSAGGALGDHMKEQLQELEKVKAGLRKSAGEIDRVKDDIAELKSAPDAQHPDQQARLTRLQNFRDCFEQEEKDLKAKEIAINSHLAELRELRGQLTRMWDSGEYRRAGSHPYKFAARLARLAYLIGSGVVYNCKSGKDRTAQLDLEVKLLSVQCEYRHSASRHQPDGDGGVTDHDIVPPYDERPPLEKRQLQAFIFQDKTRTAMQQLNTGVEGSKLNWWADLYASFLTDDDEDEDKFIGEEFRGLSARVPS